MLGAASWVYGVYLSFLVKSHDAATVILKVLRNSAMLRVGIHQT